MVTIQITAVNSVTTAEHKKNRSGKKWKIKEKYSKITLTQKLSHFVPAKFSDSFFRQFDLAMRLKRDERKNKGKVETEVNESPREKW